jgi:5-methylcytosine-specific restriction endonuclease McrA
MNIGNISKAEMREILFKETKGRCMVCGRPRESCTGWSCVTILPPAPRSGLRQEEMVILCNSCTDRKKLLSIPDYVNSLSFKKRIEYWWHVHWAFIKGRISAYKRGRLMEGFHLLVRGKPVAKVVKPTSLHMAFYEETKGCCIYCGRQLPSTGFTLDHITPRYYGGRNYSENLVTACESCNLEKSNMPVHDYVNTFSDRQLRGYVNRIKYLQAHGYLPEKKAKRLLNFENAHTHRKRVRLFKRLYTFSVTVEEL